MLINPNNPSGASYSRALLEKIVAIAVKHNLLLMVDEIYDQVLYDAAEFVSVGAAGRYASVHQLRRPEQGAPRLRLARGLGAAVRR